MRQTGPAFLPRAQRVSAPPQLRQPARTVFASARGDLIGCDNEAVARVTNPVARLLVSFSLARDDSVAQLAIVEGDMGPPSPTFACLNISPTPRANHAKQAPPTLPWPCRSRFFTKTRTWRTKAVYVPTLSHVCLAMNATRFP